MIHAKWLEAFQIAIDPECPMIRLEEPLRVGPFASIGYPGFGYTETEEEIVWVPKDHPFGVVIESGAALHSHVTIDRGTWRDTFIGKNVRLNNYVHVGHNVRIGDNVLVGVGVKIGGSNVIGDRVKIWNGVEIRQRLKIGEGSIIGMGSVVLKDVPPYATVVGNPARSRASMYSLQE